MGGLAESAACWRRNPRHVLVWRDWGGDSVVFDERTGQTHQFSPLAAAAMAWFEEGQMGTCPELTAALAADMNISVDAELLNSTFGMLEQFRNLGWIELVALPAA